MVFGTSVLKHSLNVWCMDPLGSSRGLPRRTSDFRVPKSMKGKVIVGTGSPVSWMLGPSGHVCRVPSPQFTAAGSPQSSRALAGGRLNAVGASVSSNIRVASLYSAVLVYSYSIISYKYISD